MEIIQVSIVNPRAKKLLQDLADMNLINIKKGTSSAFSALLKKLRKKSANTPTLAEITAEVEAVRTQRYSK